MKPYVLKRFENGRKQKNRKRKRLLQSGRKTNIQRRHHPRRLRFTSKQQTKHQVQKGYPLSQCLGLH
jgi:hypothetical protein